MRKSLLYLLALILITACKKNGASTGELKGVWIESTQRIDTIDFDGPMMFMSSSTFDLRSQIRTYNSLYNYSLKPDSMLLRSMFSSFSGYYSYYYRRNSAESFTIRNFYNRPSLPPVLTFERIR